MADESNPTIAPDVAAIAPEAPAKKTRAPRVKKADAKAAATTAEPVKKNRGGRPKRTDVAASPPAANTTATRGKRTAAATPTTGKRGPNRAAKPTVATSPLADDFAELLQLEEENQRLRKSLAEKLRAENADLRSRLGAK